MALETEPFDAAEHLQSPAAQADLLADAYASGDPAFIDTVLATVIRARRAGADLGDELAPARSHHEGP